MKLRGLLLTSAALLMASPIFASTYYVGFEDFAGGDYDYNDVVFSIAGSGLTVNSTGKFYTQPVLNNSGNAFWDHLSFDTPANAMNVGFCIYGGGACNGGVALDPGAQFLASAATPTVGANDITFSVNGNVTGTVSVAITAGSDTIGWYSASNPSNFHAFGSSSSVGSTYTFTPGGDFGLYGVNFGASPAQGYDSQVMYDTADPGVTHFAVFGSPASTATPEPGAMALMGLGLTGLGALLRRKKTSNS